jgi:hypothetical protein
MPAIDYSAHLGSTLPPAPAATATSAKSSSGFSFADFFDIINPLQHIPVISTLYRHLTGDEIGIPEKIAGDTLYGGLIGLAASVGDALFQEVTGKDVGDTVYAFLTDSNEQTPTGVASATPADVKPASATSLNTPDMSALLSALNRQGIDPGTAQRALYAYGRAVAPN